MKAKIIELAINNWNKSFVGISALDISEMLKLPHEDIMLLMEDLKEEEKGTLNENVKLNLITFKRNEKETDFERFNSKEIVTHIFFPSKKLLEEYFNANLIEFAENGEYVNKLHRGYNQLDLIYFDIKVLGKYINNKEIYKLSDDVTGGILRLNSEFILSLPEEDINNIWFDKVWYGKRKLSNGNIAVSAILKDLAGMTKKEQSYWYGFELENLNFAIEDEDFSRFVWRAFYGAWTNNNDPIQELKKVIEEINSVFSFKIFSNSENPYLSYPINNTFKEFADCNSELFKLIGPDNIILKSITKVYLKHCKGQKDKLVHKETGRNLSTMQVMELVLDKISKDLLIAYKVHWENVKQNRIEGDHKITIPIQTQENYIEGFRKICYDSKLILENIKNEFKKINGV